MLGHVGEMVRPVTSAAQGGRGREVRTGAVGQVVLCGGGAALSGLAPMARAAFGMPVRIAGAWGFAGPAAVQSPAYASVLGLLRWRAMVQPGSAQRASSAASSARGVRMPTSNVPGLASPAQRISQTRWQAWLREFLP
jgi:cell division ATPase FtsA